MKRILIVGATSAIAHACARQWAGAGHALYLVARDNERLTSNAADLVGRGAGRVETFNLDVQNIEEQKAMVQQCWTAFHQIDIALIAHGTLPDQAVCEVQADTAFHEFNVNATCTIALLGLLANRFEQQRCGTLAVISSVAGERGRPTNYLYGAAKAAVSTFAEGLRSRMYKLGVHVLTIKPGFVNTPMTQGLALPQALVAQPDAVASAILKAIDTRKDVIYTPAFWSLIMLVIRTIPGFIFKRLNL
ncbi:SDR family oxidoreductase [Pseudomonas massiliensis]|uniref:SDR family oxidoreductase n=1 Tax=Pseudomonas massiliensis TaxID=522492 RepID=UPI00058BB568|nr:SDR family oxidoreductase [Pseudomonas massiliensis]